MCPEILPCATGFAWKPVRQSNAGHTFDRPSIVIAVSPALLAMAGVVAAAPGCRNRRPRPTPQRSTELAAAWT